MFAPGWEAARISAIDCLAFEAGLSEDFFSGAFGAGAAGFTAAAFFSEAFGAGAADFAAGLEAVVFATGLAAGLETVFAKGFATGLAAGFTTGLATGLETFAAAAFGVEAADFLEATFFTSAGLDALGLAVGFAAFLGLALIGLALDAGFAVGFAADFLAEVLEGIGSFAAEERGIWRQSTH